MMPEHSDSYISSTLILSSCALNSIHFQHLIQSMYVLNTSSKKSHYHYNNCAKIYAWLTKRGGDLKPVSQFWQYNIKLNKKNSKVFFTLVVSGCHYLTLKILLQNLVTVFYNLCAGWFLTDNPRMSDGESACCFYFKTKCALIF